MAAVRKDGGNVHKAKTINPIYKAAKSVTNYIGGAAREIRDIPTAIGTGNAGEIRMQIREAAAAVTASQKGRAVMHRQANGQMNFGKERR